VVDLGCRLPELVGLGSFAESTSEAREDLVSRYPDDNCGLNPFVDYSSKELRAKS
jgi:hypothetical protein